MKRVTRIQLLTVLVTLSANLTTPIIRILSAVWKKKWREAYQFGDMDRDELHKRWFSEGVIAWLANLIGVSEAEHTEEFTHSVSEKLKVILIDQQFGPCPVGPAQAQANLRATVDANLQVDTFGVTIIATFRVTVQST